MEIRINYEAVYAKTQELRSFLEAELREMDLGYRQVQSSLQGMDGSTNATLMASMTVNQSKARATSETMLRLLAFMENAAREAEREEQRIARIFAMERPGITKEGGLN